MIYDSIPQQSITKCRRRFKDPPKNNFEVQIVESPVQGDHTSNAIFMLLNVIRYLSGENNLYNGEEVPALRAWLAAVVMEERVPDRFDFSPQDAADA